MPSLPRGRGLKLSGQVLVRIGMTLLLLVMLLFMQKPCADAVSHFVTGFGSDGSGSNGSAAARPVVPPPGTIDPATLLDPASDRYEHTGPNPMTIEETKAMIERARAKAAMRAGSGSAGSDPAGSGSGSRVTP